MAFVVNSNQYHVQYILTGKLRNTNLKAMGEEEDYGLTQLLVPNSTFSSSTPSAVKHSPNRTGSFLYLLSSYNLLQFFFVKVSSRKYQFFITEILLISDFTCWVFFSIFFGFLFGYQFLFIYFLISLKKYPGIMSGKDFPVYYQKFVAFFEVMCPQIYCNSSNSKGYGWIPAGLCYLNRDTGLVLWLNNYSLMNNLIIDM